MPPRPRLIAAAGLLAGVAALAGCKTKGELVIDQGVGVTAVRSRCPAVGIPDYTGDVTLFRTPGTNTADGIDVVAAMTDVRSQCSDSDAGGKPVAVSGAEAGKVYATVRFDVLARRSDTHGARQVTLPYFVTVLRGGNAVITKRIGQVTLSFADGQERAQASGEGAAYIDRAAATLPQDVRERLTRKRKAGDEDAAADPLAAPEVRSAVAAATFELLIGFQLDDRQLAYNATR